MSETNPITRVEYRPIPGYPGYRVGDDGSIWSQWIRRYSGRGRGGDRVLGATWRRLHPIPSGRYRRISLQRDGRASLQTVHRLVLEAFVGPCPPGMQCRHFDDDKANNRLSNLCWGTAIENAADARRNGVKPRGEQIGNSKLTEADVLAIREEYAAGGVIQKHLALKYGVPQVGISQIVSGKSWAHVGGPITRRGRLHKLSPEKAITIRELVAGGMTRSAVAKQFGVSEQTIHSVVHETSYSSR